MTSGDNLKAKTVKNRCIKVEVVRWDPIVARLEDYKLKI